MGWVLDNIRHISRQTASLESDYIYYHMQAISPRTNNHTLSIFLPLDVSVLVIFYRIFPTPCHHMKPCEG